jgi:hypothetical protein
MQKRQTSAIGNMSELKVATAYADVGFAVSMPLGGGILDIQKHGTTSSKRFVGRKTTNLRSTLMI